MPVNCSTSALTGQEGAVYFAPAGTKACVKDWSDFQSTPDITIADAAGKPTYFDFQVGDAVEFTAIDGATLDTGITAGTTYYVVAVTETTLQVSATMGGAAVTLNGDGGTGTADTAAPAHIEIKSVEEAVCQVREFSVEITREELDVTSLPCDPAQIGGKYAAFRKTQSGYASGTGTMTVYFTADQTSLANRLLGNVVLRSQQGASVKLYVNAVSDGGTGVDDASSIRIEADISITSMSMSVNPDDPTTAELSFTIVNPKHILGAEIAS